MDAAVASRGGRFFLLGRPAFLATALGWSVPFWLFFELLNLRLENWYYVFLPREPAARWAGIALSFATVIPAVLLAERLLGSVGLARNVRVRSVRVPPAIALQAVGVLMLLLPLAWPRVFFPLAWGGVLLIVDPWVRARDSARSLLGDLERGDPGRIVRLLAGGLGVGLLWETFNVAARGKWIYTVPGFEDLKLFEMPVLGFLGFPFFALEAFAVWQALVVAGLAVPAEGRVASQPWPRIAAAALLAAGFTAVMIAAMHRHTIASVAPAVSDFGVPAARLRAAGIDDPWELAKADPGPVAAATGVEDALARAWVERARLATLRGIGAPNAARLAELGVETVGALAAVDPDRLGARLAAAGTPVDPARLRVWVRAAREADRRGATRPSS
jgi:predicted flap endonuclease-1-like 5' DNA nuclease